MSQSIGESLARFTDSIGSTVSVTFKNISMFLDTIMTLFTTLGFWIAVLVFFAIFLILLFSPLWIIKFWDDLNQQYTRFTDRFIRGISK